MPTPPVAATFLEWLFAPAIEAGLFYQLWTAPGKQSYFFNDIAAGAAKATELIESQNVYVACGLFRAPLEQGRGKLDDIAGIVGLWGDLDYGPVDPAIHRRAALPPDEKSAWLVMDESGATPSIVVHSGNGLQGWWLFREPWIFKDDADKQAAVKLSRRWVHTLRAVAEAHRWSIDFGVWDLTRVLRLPGTLNHKSTPPKPTSILKPLESQPARRNPDEYEILVIADEYESGGDRARAYVPVHPVQIRPGAPLPQEVTILLENDALFKKTWERKRPNLKDQSGSGYDLALANILVAGGFTDQQIADVILAWRKHHNENVAKAMRRDYLMRTIGKARQGRAAENALAELNAQPVALNPTAGPEEKKELNNTKLEHIKKCLGIQPRKFIQYGTENATYHMVLEDGRDILIGSIENLLSPDKVAGRIAEATRILIAPMKRDAWRKLIEHILGMVEVIEDLEGRRDTAIVDYVRRYIYSRTLYGENEYRDAVRDNDPFLYENKLHLHVASLGKYLRAETDEKITNAQLRGMLRLIGFKGGQLSVRTSEEKTYCRYYWSGEKDIIKEHLQERQRRARRPVVGTASRDLPADPALPQEVAIGEEA
jgi:hypothetical protein